MTDRRALRRLAAGTVLVAFDGTQAPGWLLTALGDDGYAGVCLFGSNIASDEQVAGLTARLRAASPHTVVSVDEEGGDVTRLAHAYGSPYPGNAALGAVDDPELTERVYHAIGADLGALGFTLDFAPSADVNSADDNPVIGTRSFGADPDLVARHTAAAVRGLHRAGIRACVKHFPGHGATSVDSHFAVPTVDIALDVLHKRELAPFVAAIEAGVDVVMTGHVRVPVVTGDVPATLSRAALTDLLRGDLDFDGVVVSDSMEMAAIRATVGMADGAALALAAGADLLCTGGELRGRDIVDPMVEAIVRAVEKGTLSEERLVEASVRVRRLGAPSAGAKASGSSADPNSVSGAAAPGGAIADGAVGLQAARRAVRVLAGYPHPLRAPLVVELNARPGMAVGFVPWGLAASLSDLLAGTEVRRVTEDTADVATLLDAAVGRSLVVVTRDAHRFDWQHRLVAALTARRSDVVVVEMGLPAWRPSGAAAFVATYGAGRSNGRAAAELLAGAR
jgi:beta-N-acetylhexosaminidase